MNHPEFNFEQRKSAAEFSESFLEKIKKLLRLSESGNPHEAALAMSRAMQLADRHNLDISSLSLDDEVAPIIHKYFPLGSRMSHEEKLATALVTTCFNVDTCLIGRGRILYVGKEEDVLVAEYVFSFLVSAYRRCAASYALAEKKDRRRMTTAKRYSFRCGFFYGVASELKKSRDEILLEDQKFALVLADQKARREEELSSLVGETMLCKEPKKRRQVASALVKGYEKGCRTRINTALGNKEALALSE
jgi:hypothetical protein